MSTFSRYHLTDDVELQPEVAPTLSQSLVRALVVLALSMVMLGVMYPFGITLVGKLGFAAKADGSLLMNHKGELIGSALIGQRFSDARYFQGRPSASDYQSGAASNLADTNPAFAKAVLMRYQQWRERLPGEAVPAPLLMASASGLDPVLDEASVRYQAPAIAAARQLPLPQVLGLVSTLADNHGRKTPVVNILALNRALDALSAATPQHSPATSPSTSDKD
ncbi:potassium-transporting ATPase subunit C [Pokkaliibacter sp. CJK22405]|uniref:potassium-transporting ATPase subunit C n=1 Tax=Pokkaliibacter sp. CJK22405 TaxID=3384615 RepID=UPI0039855B67